MCTRPVAAITALCFISLNLTGLRAQQPARGRLLNPEAIEFSVSGSDDRTLDRYQLELYADGSDPDSTAPLRSIAVRPSNTDQTGVVRIPLLNSVIDVTDGAYIATLRILAADGYSVRSEPSEVFVLAREGSVEERLEDARRERFWTRVALAIGASLLLVPLILR